MKENRTKKILNDGGVVFGTFATEIGTPEVARMMSASGFDFMFLDTEHSPFTMETVISNIRSTKHLTMNCFVRVADAEYHLIARTLDAGAEGIMVPRIETGETALKATSSVKYPPLGVRGYGVRGIITDYEPSSMGDVITHLNNNTMVILQIESKQAVENIHEIASVKGVDVALIGPNDLSISLGIPGEYKNPIYLDAVEKVIQECNNSGISAGIHNRSIEDIAYWKKRGIRFLLYSTDSALLLESASRSVKELKSL